MAHILVHRSYTYIKLIRINDSNLVDQKQSLTLFYSTLYNHSHRLQLATVNESTNSTKSSPTTTVGKSRGSSRFLNPSFDFNAGSSGKPEEIRTVRASVSSVCASDWAKPKVSNQQNAHLRVFNEKKIVSVTDPIVHWDLYPRSAQNTSSLSTREDRVDESNFSRKKKTFLAIVIRSIDR